MSGMRGLKVEHEGRTVVFEAPEGAGAKQIQALAAKALKRANPKSTFSAPQLAPDVQRLISTGKGAQKPSPAPSEAPQSHESHWRQQLAGQGSLAAGESGWRDDLAQYLSRLGELGGLNERKVYDRAQDVLGIADFIPGVGEATGAADTAQAAGRGNWLEAGINGLATALGTVPFIGDAAGGLTKAMFLGAKARNADLGALRQAEKLRAAGVSEDQIWRSTGWGWGVDGKPRFEISDQPLQLADATKARPRTLGEAVHHPELFENYPDLADVSFGWMGGKDASYRLPSEIDPETIQIGYDLPEHQIPRALGHELQHGVQAREGFSLGSSPTYAPRVFEGPKVEALEGQIAALTDKVRGLIAAGYSSKHSAVPQANEQLQKLRDRRQLQASYNGYHRSAGEVEARNTEERLSYPPLARRAIAPHETADVPAGNQWVEEPFLGAPWQQNPSPWRKWLGAILPR